MLDSPFKGVIYNSLKSSFLVWLVQLGSVLWASIQVEYSMDDTLCYDLRSLGLDNRTTLVLSNTRELDRDLFTK